MWSSSSSNLLTTTAEVDLDCLQYLNSLPLVKPESNLIRCVCRLRYYNVENKLAVVQQLTMHENVDPFAIWDDTNCFIDCCRLGETAIVRYFMQMPNCDPSVLDNKALELAQLKNFEELAALLRTDYR